MTHLIAIQYCFDYLVNQIPLGLLLYTHIPTAVVAILFGLFLVLHTRTLASVTLFVVCASFAAWCVLDLGAWFAFLGAGSMMFTWALTDLTALTFFFFSYYFLYSFITKRDLPVWQKIAGVLLLLPTAFWTFTGSTLTLYDATICEAWEHEWYTLYPYVVEGILILASIVAAIREYFTSNDKKHRNEVVLASVGVLAFLLFFFTSTLAVNFLVNYDIIEFAYNFEIYGLFGMPILLVYLGYLIVRYRAFDVRVFGAQALIIVLVVLIAAEFAFVSGIANRVLVGVTLIFTSAVGIILVRSVKREIEQRQRIERLARDLELANDQQVTLIHFITHQIKGFVTKSRDIFSMMKEGDFGVLPDTMTNIVDQGFASDTNGIATIQEILNAANIRSGKVTFTMASFDLKALIEGVVRDLKPAADAKSLSLVSNLGTEPLMVNGDAIQLVNAYKNLIDNSIKYTPSGSVSLNLEKKDGKAVLTIADTGVGITPEDMKNLFTEGGHGKESTKVNVESTGFGLYIVKNLIEAHKGRVWAESEGAGKGSRFIVELPI